METNDFVCQKGALFADKPLVREWNCLFGAWKQVGQEDCTLLPWCGHRVPPFRQLHWCKLSLPAILLLLGFNRQDTDVHMWVFCGLWVGFFWVFFEVFLYTWVSQTSLKSPTYLYMILNALYRQKLWAMSEALGISPALLNGWTVIVQAILVLKNPILLLHQTFITQSCCLECQ